MKLSTILAPIGSNAKKIAGGSKKRHKPICQRTKKENILRPFVSANIASYSSWGSGKKIEDTEEVLVLIKGRILGQGGSASVYACSLERMYKFELYQKFDKYQEVFVKDLDIYFILTKGEDYLGIPHKLCVKITNAGIPTELIINEICALEKCKNNPSPIASANLAQIPKIHAVLPMGKPGFPLFIIMDRLPGDDFITHLETLQKETEPQSNREIDVIPESKHIWKLPEPEARWIAEKIARTLLHLHSIGIFHMDLKPENILIDFDSREVSIVDFGTAIVIDLHDEYQILERNRSLGTLQYMCPEMSSGGTYDPSSVDSWGLGVLLFTMVSGVFPPKPPVSVKQTCVYNGLSSSLTRVLCDLLQYDPNFRLGLPRILRSSWIREDR